MFIKNTDVKTIEKTSEGYHLLENIRGSWFFSYDHNGGKGRWYGPHSSKDIARVAMLKGHINTDNYKRIIE